MMDLRKPVGYVQPEGLDVFSPAVKQLHAHAGQRLKLLQVGANNGEHEDPVVNLIKDDIVEAILVEPLPHLAEMLQVRYARNAAVKVEQCAIGVRQGALPFFFLQDNVGTDLTAISSLDRDYVRKWERHFNRVALPGQIVVMHEMPVTVRTVGELLDDNGWNELDILVVDAEGLDGEIVRSVLTTDLPIKVIFFEYSNLSWAEYAAVTSELKRADYKMAQSGKDILAISKSVQGQGKTASA